MPVTDRYTGYHISGGNIACLWDSVIHNIMEHGAVCAPRGLKTRETLGVSICLDDLRNNILVNPTRDLNYRFMVAEWLWILTGHEDVESIARYNEQIKQFSDDGVIFNGAYGPRLASQWAWVIEQLRQLPDTRQAVASIWRNVELTKPTKDVPCTLTFQFLRRNEKLNLIATMRSSDAWLGLPYDMFNFAQLANWVAAQLEIEPGFLLMQLGSCHLYEDKWELAKKVITESYSTYVRSPKLTPASRDYLGVLFSLMADATGRFKRPWTVYDAVLRCHNRKEALEVLREASLS